MRKTRRNCKNVLRNSSNGTMVVPMRNTRVAAAIRAEIGRQHKTASGVARDADKTQTWMWRRLNEQTAITVDDLELIAAALNVPAVDLLTDERGAA